MPEAKRTTKITKRTVDALKPNGADFYAFDSELIGFGVRVRKSGGMSYIVRYRAGSGRNAPVRRVTIAKVGKITPEQARDAAKDILASVVKGEDPARERAEARKAATFAELANDFLAHIEARRKPNTLAQYRHMLDTYAIPKFGTRKAGSITPSDVAALHQSLRDKAATANRVRDVMSSMFGWAVRTKLLPKKTENPAAGVEKFPEAKRERYLSTEEIQRLGAAIREAETVGIPWEPNPEKKTKHAPKAENRRTKIEPTVAAALRLFILTGARLREVLRLTWDMVDLERGLLLLPDSKTGQKAIVLNAPAQVILSELPRTSRYVIPGKPRKRADGSTESRPRSDLKRPWSRVRKRAGLDASVENPAMRVRIHDLRHTHASIGVGANLGLPIVGKLLGHTQARTTERYAHLEADPVRKASDTIGRRIANALGDDAREDRAANGNVVPIKPAGGSR